MRHVFGHLVLVALVLVTVAANPAAADHFNNLTGLASPDQTITFDEHTFVNGTFITNQYSDFGVVFSPALEYSTPDFGDPNIVPPWLFTGPTGLTAIDISFTNNVDAAALTLVTSASTTSTFTALFNGNVIESFSASTDSTSSSNFFGFTNIQFNELAISWRKSTSRHHSTMFSTIYPPSPNRPR